MTCGIYKIENKIDGKVYIGQSVNIEDRWIKHKSVSQNINHENAHYKIYRAIRKHGLENFIFSIIEECSKENLDDKEKEWINFYDSYKNGYNQTLGGQSLKAHGTKLTQIQIEEITELLKNTKISINNIANKYNVHPCTITHINTGKTWFRQNLVYPIRERNNKTCINCGKKLKSNNSILCKECYIKSIQLEIPSKEELKNKIRKLESFEEVASYYDKIGTSIIRTWCKRYNLPTIKKEIDSYSDEEWDVL